MLRSQQNGAAEAAPVSEAWIAEMKEKGLDGAAMQARAKELMSN